MLEVEVVLSWRGWKEKDCLEETQVFRYHRAAKERNESSI